jgi:phosphatidylglycerophosphatase A
VYKNFFHHVLYWISVGGGTGFLPMPGTMGTLFIGIPVVLVWNWCMSSSSYAVSWVLVGMVTMFAERALASVLPYFPAVHDPQCINLDEVIGFLWALHGLPLSRRSLAIGFVLFRIFDITKIMGIEHLQRIEGAWGVIADDILAGVYTRCLMIMFFL